MEHQHEIISWALAIAIVLLMLLVAFYTTILRDGPTGGYSFSRFQLWLWTAVICPAFVLHWGYHFPQVVIHRTELILLAMSGGTTLTSWVVASVRKMDKKKCEKDSNNKDIPNFWRDILKDEKGNYSIPRLQQLVFTIAYVVIYIAIFFNQSPNEYPVFDNQAFYLMGISYGGYLWAKSVE